MADEQTFYAAVLSAGAILTGFSGTFLQFRIQREANYYRQPVLSYVEGAEQGKAQDVPIGLVHFTGAFLLIIVSTLMAVTFGFVFPLLALAQMEDIEEMRTGDDRSMPPLLRAEVDRLRRRLVMTLEMIREVEAEGAPDAR
jgi:hypothetical protein